MKLEAADFEAVDRSTLAGLAPRAVHEDDGWLIALDDGAVGRANSVASFRLGGGDLSARVATAEALYREAGLPPAFRPTDRRELDPLRARLAADGYEPRQPTVVMVAEAAGVRSRLRGSVAQIDRAVDDAWTAAFAGDGFDPEDGRRRVAVLSRAPGAAYASVREDGRALSVGVATFGFGWAGLHGVRTAASRRGEGLAGRVILALAGAAQARGVERLFLQMERDNAPARALYLRAGFETAAEYAYWRRPQSP